MDCVTRSQRFDCEACHVVLTLPDQATLCSPLYTSGTCPTTGFMNFLDVVAMGMLGPKRLVAVSARYFSCDAVFGSEVHAECIFPGVCAVTEITGELDTQVIHLMVTSQVPCLAKNGAANPTLHRSVALQRWIQSK